MQATTIKQPVKQDSKFWDLQELEASAEFNGFSSSADQFQDLQGGFVELTHGHQLESKTAACHSGHADASSQYTRNRNTLIDLVDEATRLIHDVRATLLDPGRELLHTCTDPAERFTESLRVLGANPRQDAFRDVSKLQAQSGEVDDLAVATIKTELNADVTNHASPIRESWISAKLLHSVGHLQKLRSRLLDTRSKVLVTGDLNAGKSTFVNAVLGRQVVPQDQQPCTNVFCEVIHSAEREGDPDIEGKEEIHAIPSLEEYDAKNSMTYDRYDLNHLQTLVLSPFIDDKRGSGNVVGAQYELVKIYVTPSSFSSAPSSLLLNNSHVSVTLIDSPGLNIDFDKTMKLFNTQEEIDVVVFLVHAENQFTLSAKEFLSSASTSKPLLFVVVNRFDMIEDRPRCKREILNQIREISPQTYEDREGLVHFVSCRNVLRRKANGVTRELTTEEQEDQESFHNMIDSLQSFILDKRNHSKLLPAKQYLTYLLTDLSLLLTSYTAMCDNEQSIIDIELSRLSPGYDKLVMMQNDVMEAETIVDALTERVEKGTQEILDVFINQLASLPISSPGVLSFSTLVSSNVPKFTFTASYSGFLHIFTYAHSVEQEILGMVSNRVKYCEAMALKETRNCVDSMTRMARDSGVQWEPKTDGWVQEDMMNMNMNGSGDLVLLTKEFKPTLTMKELLDIPTKMALVQSYLPGMAMIAGGVVGYSRLAGGILRIGNIVGVKGLIKVVSGGIVIVGLALLYTTTTTLPQRITSLITSQIATHLQETSFSQSQSRRISRLTRRTLRLNLWEFQLSFQKALEESKNRRNVWQSRAKEVDHLKLLLGTHQRKVTGLMNSLDLVKLDV